jgi:hypothetical protein
MQNWAAQGMHCRQRLLAYVAKTCPGVCSLLCSPSCAACCLHFHQAQVPTVDCREASLSTLREARQEALQVGWQGVGGVVLGLRDSCVLFKGRVITHEWAQANDACVSRAPLMLHCMRVLLAGLVSAR